jgi:hypothetical protein
MSQNVTIESINYSGENASVFFLPDNDTTTINLGVKQIPFVFNPNVLVPPREIYGTYTIITSSGTCINSLVVPRPATTTTTTTIPVTTTTTTFGPINIGIYHGKFSGATITSGDVSTFIFTATNNPTNNYVSFSSTPNSINGYILIPTFLPQPSEFRDSSVGCSGSNIPINLIGQLIIPDINSYPITYNIYRTYWSFAGQVDCWLCS